MEVQTKLIEGLLAVSLLDLYSLFLASLFIIIKELQIIITEYLVIGRKKLPLLWKVTGNDIFRLSIELKLFGLSSIYIILLNVTAVASSSDLFQ